MTKFIDVLRITRRGKNNQNSNALTVAVARKQAEKDMKQERKLEKQRRKHGSNS